MNDEKESNLQWIIASSESFDDAVEESNYSLARNIIDDCFDNGFTKEAQDMSDRLEKAEHDYKQQFEDTDIPRL